MGESIIRSSAKRHAAKAERAAIVAWLREKAFVQRDGGWGNKGMEATLDWASDAIERGEHVKGRGQASITLDGRKGGER